MSFFKKFFTKEKEEELDKGLEKTKLEWLRISTSTLRN